MKIEPESYTYAIKKIKTVDFEGFRCRVKEFPNIAGFESTAQQAYTVALEEVSEG